MEKKNPLIAGLLNAFVPGFGNYYVDKNLKGFILTLISCVVLIFLAITLGTAIQDIKNSTLLSGLCPVALVLVILVPLFLKGMQLARTHNANIDNTARFNESRQSMKGTQQAKLDQARKMRDEGLISKEEYDQKKDKMDGEKKSG
jgi:hypothetical protein